MNQPVFTFSPKVKYLKPHNPAPMPQKTSSFTDSMAAAALDAEKPARPVLHLPSHRSRPAAKVLKSL